MELKELLEQFDLLQKKRYAYHAASSALYLDAVTVAPKNTSEGRGIALSILAGEEQKLLTSEETGTLLQALYEKKEALSFELRRQVEELMKQYQQISRIPADEYMTYAMLVNEAGDVWHKAKEASDFEMFCPVLEKLVEMTRKFAYYYDNSKKPYDALLNEYERGVDMEQLDQFFGALRKKLVPLIKAIGTKPQVETAFLYQHYPIELQRKFSDYLMEVMQLDRGHCTIGETEHPFTLEFNNKDVRITTKYKENNLVDSMFSVIHEAGHAKYELGIRDDLQYTCLSSGVSMGIHESQSRFYENLIGRSEAFIQAIFPKMQALFPEQLKDVNAHQMYLAVNRVEPSLIRTEADELTYSLHVMIRYEIEKQLIDGSLNVKDIPGVWNQLYKEYLGVDVPNDREGCLQDSHWSGGSFGYFPSYALGSAYGVQMLKEMEKDVDIWGDASKGDLTKISAWLGEHVHQYGSLIEPADLIKKICGGFDPDIYAGYLLEKYSKIYNIDLKSL